MNDRHNITHVHITGEIGNRVGEDIFINEQNLCELIERDFKESIQEYVPSYHTVTVYVKNNYIMKESFINKVLLKWEHQQNGNSRLRRTRTIRIPVCYEDIFALDMGRVMKHTGLRAEEIVHLHTSTFYTVFMIGFLPGFPYLGGLNGKLSTSRIEKPRLQVSKGTVGIGGHQTGIYPLDSPGGWNIFGRTPVDIFAPTRKDPFFIHAGDQLSFYSITSDEYEEMKEILATLPESINRFLTCE